MYMYFGDSNSRQFVGHAVGVHCHYVFSGATIRGLTNNQSTTGSSKIIRHALGGEVVKTAFFMFGSVDFDFSLIREQCARPEMSVSTFLDARIASYTGFMDALFQERDIDHTLRQAVIIAPQLSPLRGGNFFRQTTKHIGVPEEQIRSAARRRDMSDATRAGLIITFNDRLAAAFQCHERVDVLRIDLEMIDGSRRIKDEFVPQDVNDHHAIVARTLNLWRPLMARHIIDHMIVG